LDTIPNNLTRTIPEIADRTVTAYTFSKTYAMTGLRLGYLASNDDVLLDRCTGCGACVAECPAKAIELNWYEDNQILSKVDALLEGVL